MKKTIIIALVFLTALFFNSAFSQVEFSAIPQSGCTPLTVTFTNTTTSPGAYYYWWSFGDGTPDIFDTLSTTITHTFNEPGNYWVWLEARDSMYNYIGNGYFVVEVQGIPSQFNISTDSVCPGDLVQLSIDGNFSFVYWDFGDSTYSNGQYEQHDYANPGNYTVTLVITSALCSITDTIQQTIKVRNNLPVPDFTVDGNPNPACPGDKINFIIPYELTGMAFYEWDYGDGNAYSTPYYYDGNAHPYSDTGIFIVSLTITNSCGNVETKSDTLSIENNIPITGFLWLNHDPYQSCPGDVVRFYGPWGFSTYLWNFGDATTDTTINSSTEHAYSGTGSYGISLTVINGCGYDTTIFDSVDVSGNNPITGYLDIYSDGPGCPGDIIGFSGEPYGVYDYSWDFGDGNYATGPWVMHAYTSTGNYTVSMTATNGCGNDSTVTTIVSVVNNLPVDMGNYDYGFTADTACPGDSVIFWTWPSSGNYLWDFGDGNTGVPTATIEDAKILYYAYSSLGDYAVTLTVTNGCGNSAVDSFMMITIGNNTPAEFSVEAVGNPDSMCVGKPIELVAFGSGTSFIWYFGDGDSAITTSPGIAHTYSAAGIYTLILEGTNGCGNSGSDTLELIIDQCIVGIAEPYPANENLPAVYPNPSDGIFALLMQLNENSPVSVVCYDIIGQKIPLMQNVSFNKGSHTLKFDLNRLNFHEGIYFIELNSGDQQYRLKIIVSDTK